MPEFTQEIVDGLDNFIVRVDSTLSAQVLMNQSLVSRIVQLERKCEILKQKLAEREEVESGHID